MNIPDKALKCLNLALNDSAPEGEWNAAAIRFCAILRKSGIDIAAIFPAKKSPVPRKRATWKPEPTKSRIPTMPFGKFKGQAIEDLPDWYLDWCLEQEFIKDPLRSEIETENQCRNAH